jgi:hypothetical protein
MRATGRHRAGQALRCRAARVPTRSPPGPNLLVNAPVLPPLLRPRLPPRPCPSIWWQVVPYFLLGASETFTNVGERAHPPSERLKPRRGPDCLLRLHASAPPPFAAPTDAQRASAPTRTPAPTGACPAPPAGILELFFTQVSEGMRALGASFYLLSVAVGTYMASALNIIVAKIFPNDLWVAGEAAPARGGRPRRGPAVWEGACDNWIGRGIRVGAAAPP